MLIRHTLAYLPAQVLAPLLQAVGLIAWAYLLAPEAVGVVTLVVAINDIGLALFHAWWSGFVLRHLPRLRVAQLAGFLGSEPPVLAGCLALQALILAPVLALYFAPLDPALLAAMLAYLASRALATHLAERARADARVLTYSLVQIGGQAGGLLLALGCIAWIGPSAFSVLLGLALGQMPFAALGALRTDLGRGGLRLDPLLLRQALAFGLPVMATQVLAVAAANAPRFIVDRGMGLAEAGIFAVSYGMGLRISSLAAMTVTAGAYPLAVRMFEEKGQDAAYAQLHRNALLLAGVVLPSAFGLIAIAAPLAGLLPPAFQATGQVVLPLAACCGVLRDLRAHTVNQIFLLHNRPRIAALLALGDLLVSIALALSGMAAWGLAGAVIGSLAGAALGLIAAVALAAGFGFHLPWSGLGRVGAAALLMAACVFALPISPNIASLVGAVSLGTGLYGVLIMVLFKPVRRAFVGFLAKPRKESDGG